ncbi:MAG TPA: 2-amino-4-hydroxy-6-hydroxymethyldihydropteridine diphosphokinase [Candidatus Glassbacteria bacterium]|nr:2-amino-4-hydroxy-6-hydroxymethyldihydropteridine diphosphokinase [Candidatus Glassbacteria bacterium]
MNRVVIAVGSNIEPEANIEKARSILAGALRLVGESAFVRTAPVGIAEQPDFINGAFLVETSLDCDRLRRYLKEVEKRIGRVRGAERYGPRRIDLDIVVWNGEVVDEDFYVRDFLRAACCELLPELSTARKTGGRSPGAPA